MKSGISGDKIATKRWVRERIRLYAKRAGLIEMPHIEFGHIAPDTEGAAGYKAIYTAVTNTIKVDLGEALCRHDMDDTAAHEIVHARWASLDHNDLFARRVRALREGHRLGKPGSPLPKEFR